MLDLTIRDANFGNVSAVDAPKSKNVRENFKSVLSDEIIAVETFDDMWKSTLEENFGQFSQNFCHIMDATGISLEF